MRTKEKIDELFIEEIEKCLEDGALSQLPVTIKVEQDILPNIERWKEHE